MEMRRGTIARCSLGALGLITCDEPQEVSYKDGNKGRAWVGVQLTDKLAPIGSPWSSRIPTPVCDVSDLLADRV